MSDLNVYHTSPLPRAIFIIFVACSALVITTLNRELGSIDGDNAQYIFLAQSIATDQSYRTINEPGAPPETYFPPLFPMMLAPIVNRWGLHTYFPIHLLVVAWAIACLGLWIIWARRQLTDEQLAWSLALFGTAPLWVVFANRILTEIPFLGWSLGAIMLAERYQQQSRAWTTTGVATALLLAAAYLTRTAGLALVAVVSSWLLLGAWREDRWRLAAGRAATLLLITGGIVGAWHMRCHLATLGAPESLDYWKLLWLRNPYQPELGLVDSTAMVERLADNLRYYLKVAAETLVDPIRMVPTPWVYGVAMVPVGLTAYGFLRRLTTSRTVAEWYLIGYGLLLWYWPFQEPRFLVPILPWLCGYFVVGVDATVKRLAPPLLHHRLLGAIVALTLAVNLATIGRSFAANAAGHHYNLAVREWLDAHDWIAAHTPPEVVIMSRKPTVTALITDRRAVGYPLLPNPDDTIALIERYHVTHIIHETSDETARYLTPAILQHRDRFEPDVQPFGRTIVISVKPSIQPLHSTTRREPEPQAVNVK